MDIVQDYFLFRGEARFVGRRQSNVLGELLDIGEVGRLVRDLKGRHYNRPARSVQAGD
jgi:hypothetical protein